MGNPARAVRLLLLGALVAVLADAREQTPFERGLEALAAGKLDRADEAFSACIASGVGKQAALVNRGVTRLRAGRAKDAGADFDEAIRLDADDAVAYYNRAVARTRIRLEKSVLTDLARALELARAGKGGPEAAALETRLPALARLKGILEHVDALHEKAERAAAELKQKVELRRTGAVSDDAVDWAWVRLSRYRWLEDLWRGDLDAARKHLAQEVKVCRTRYQRALELQRSGAGLAEEAETAELYLRLAEVEQFRLDGQGDEFFKTLERIVALRRLVYERAVNLQARGVLSREEVEIRKRLVEDAGKQLKTARAAPPTAKQKSVVADVIGPPIVRRLPGP